MKRCQHKRDNIPGKPIEYAIPMLVIFGGKCVSRRGFQSFQQFFPCGVRGLLRLHGHYLNCILVETTLCDIFSMHYVFNIIYQLNGEDNASILTF